MKKIEAIIRVSKLEAVKDALVARGVEGMTIAEVYGRGIDKGQPITYRGITTTGAVPRIKLETVVPDEDVEPLIDAIFQAAHTGEVGDGRILVVDVESVMRIRTGEMDDHELVSVAHSGPSHLARSRR
jgi:nitrogen regulatory protein PII